MSYQDLSIYFSEELKSINKRRGSKLSQDCLVYISDLLINGAKSDFLFEDNKKKYLVDLYERSVMSNGKYEKFNNYKHMGDYSLIISGYFTESINKVVGVKYYIDMGSLAYEQAAHSLYRDPYLELAKSYPDCVAILNELSISNKEDNSNDILKLYDFWFLTKSEYTKEKLLKLGVLAGVIED